MEVATWSLTNPSLIHYLAPAKTSGSCCLIPRLEGHIHNQIKGTCEKSSAYITLNGEDRIIFL